MTTPSSASRAVSTTADVLAQLASTPEPDLRTWLRPGRLAPLCRVRRDGESLWLRLSPGDPRRGPGSADRCYLTVSDGTVLCEQRPGPVGVLLVGGVFVVGWALAGLAGAYGVATGSLAYLVGVPIVLLLRTVAETGRRIDQRRFRAWIVRRLAEPTTADPADPADSSAPFVSAKVAAPVWTVADADCTG